MKNRRTPFILLVAVASLLVFVGSLVAQQQPDAKDPFGLKLLRSSKAVNDRGSDEETTYEPRNPYSIFINYELGMHCVGFDVSYCCIIPPYNSVQAQVVQAGAGGQRPRLLSPDDKVTLYYHIKDNSYSEGNKMRFWEINKDVNGDGSMGGPGDNMANYVWTHLFIYSDLDGTLPKEPAKSGRKHIGMEIPVNIDSGPSGKNVSGGYMSYSGERGGNIVFTDSLIPQIRDIPLTLTASYSWDALGLPLTAFNDSRRKGSIRTVTDYDFQPYQYAVVQLRDQDGRHLISGGKDVEFFGTEPVDISNCLLCHSGKGRAASLSREEGLSLFDREYDYWKKNYTDASDYYSRLASATIGILELHDRHHGTTFLKNYDSGASSNRLGSAGSVNCTDCHGDNISGNLQSPRPGATGYQTVKAPPLTEAVHSVHGRRVPMPDRAGRTQGCQVCHPTHWQDTEMNNSKTNPYAITDDEGIPRFSNSDLRVAGGGCFLRRDAHSNPSARPPFFLNEIGKWYLNNVSMRDELRKPVKEMRGLYCTNCHNQLAHELYAHDDLKDAASQEGKSLRNKPLDVVINTISGGDEKRFASYFADPTVDTKDDPLVTYYAGHRGGVLGRTSAGQKGLLPWNAREGKIVSYNDVSGGSDWWLSPGEPHCADCHIAPFVESGGGRYFPVDQPGKYSLYRYSKAHGSVSCQSCHESVHGLYPVRYEGPQRSVDLTSHEQALQFSPDGEYAGPVTCSNCHTVNKTGIPVLLKGTEYYSDYWSSVVLIHFMREGDQKLPVRDLLGKYPYATAREVFLKGGR